MKRVTAEFRRGQIASLGGLIAQAETCEMVATDQIAIGISEDPVKTFLNASLPREIVVAKRLRVRVESAEASFREGKAALVIVTGLFNNMTLTLKNLKGGEAKVKAGFGKKTVGKYILDVQIHRVQGVLRPGQGLAANMTWGNVGVTAGGPDVSLVRLTPCRGRGC